LEDGDGRRINLISKEEIARRQLLSSDRTYLDIEQILGSDQHFPSKELKHLRLHHVDLREGESLERPSDDGPTLVRKRRVRELLVRNHESCEEQPMTRRAVMMRIEVVKTLEEDEGCGEDGVGELSSVDGVSDEVRKRDRVARRGWAAKHCLDLGKGKRRSEIDTPGRRRRVGLTKRAGARTRSSSAFYATKDIFMRGGRGREVDYEEGTFGRRREVS